MELNLMLFIVCMCFCLVSFGNAVEFDNFYVEKSGHSRVKPGQIGVVFFMTVANSGQNSKKIYSKSTKCCWTHPGSDWRYDCESMDLLGGMPVTLEPSKTANITYLFTNLYPLDRVGQCVFHLWHSNNKIAHTIRFNTTYQSKVDDSWLGSLYKTIAGDDKKKITICDTMDLDPRRKCKPVSCVQKYNGKRNFFRKETKLCEPVHECFTSRDEDGLPTTAFDKDHNSCKSLIQKELSKDEEKDLKDNVESHMEASEKAKFKSIGPDDPIPIRCNHGKRAGEMCVCEDGWKTDTSNVPLGDPRFVYNWCNVKTRKKPLLPYKQQKHFMIAGLSLTSFTLLVSWLWMIHRYIYPPPEVEKQHHRHRRPATHRADENKHVWTKTNLVATSKLLKELGNRSMFKKPKMATPSVATTVEQPVANETTVLSQDGNSIPGKDSQGIAGTPIQKGNSALLSMEPLSPILEGGTPLVEHVPQSPRQQTDIAHDVPEVPIAQSRNGSISGNPMVRSRNGSVSEQGRNDLLSGRKIAQRKSAPVTSSRRPSQMSDIRTQQRSSSLPGQISQETPNQDLLSGDTVPHQRSASLPGQIPLEDSSIKGSPAVSKGVAKEPSMIVASRTTRAGSTFTLIGNIPRHVSTPAAIESFSDSD